MNVPFEQKQIIIFFFFRIVFCVVLITLAALSPSELICDISRCTRRIFTVPCVILIHWWRLNVESVLRCVVETHAPEIVIGWGRIADVGRPCSPHLCINILEESPTVVGDKPVRPEIVHGVHDFGQRLIKSSLVFTSFDRRCCPVLIIWWSPSPKF